MESSNTSDYSLTDNDLDLDSTKEIEEMCRVGTLAERFSLTSFKPFQRDVHSTLKEMIQLLFSQLPVEKVFATNFLQYTQGKWQ